MSAFADQHFVVAGAGSAGIGIVDTLCVAMTSMYGLSTEEARSRFWIVDHNGKGLSKSLRTASMAF